MFLFVNAHAVTRHYGGPEEGGWWYNTGEARASIPVRAEKREGHKPETCPVCDEHREGRSSAARNGETAFCKEDIEDDELDIAFDEWSASLFNRSLIEMDDYRELRRQWREHELPDISAFWQSHYHLDLIKSVTHLSPIDSAMLAAVRAGLEATMEDESYGNIGSVNGGVEIRVSVDDKFAENWSDYRPYE